MNNLAPVTSISVLNAFPGLVRTDYLQKTLVPPIDYRDYRMEAHAQTTPMDEVGGDLADLVSAGPEVTAYVADVSGHGLRAGVLMGMLKTAMRYGLHLGQPLAKLLDHINVVLPAVKESNMYATLAALRFDGTNEVEYLSAGHVPLLQYRKRTREVVRHAMDQFPLGLFQGFSFASRRIRYEAGDIFALVSDGIVEAGIDRESEFGFDRLAQILRTHASSPLSEIYEVVRSAVDFHASQEDDQTVLLVRALA
ncbi:MAG TPA: PP2C family protein-serine/threonine phosphatase [Bryobacteraceae bacterium]|nr:PP2C family protein-serine/threonine phosphatase [Bryobacteraceae bacterium]